MNWMFYLKTTETCNLNCSHCFTNGINGAKIYFDPTKVSDWVIKFHKEKFKPGDTIHYEFHGGEPFLAPLEHMKLVVDKCKDLSDNRSFGATTNLTYKLKQDQIDFIKNELGGRIGTSWDPKIRFANNKQYRLWHSNVKTLLAEGINIKLFISVTQDTIAYKPITLLRWIRRLGVQEVSFERLTSNGSAKMFPQIFPTNIQLDQWFLDLHKHSDRYNARSWFDNESLENVYSKFESGYNCAGTFCRDCEEKIFTINADGTISGCPNAAPEFNYGSIEQDIQSVINSPRRIRSIVEERSRNPNCYSCPVFRYCNGDCHQLEWQGDVCGAPKSLMKLLAGV
jgi:radical SAM protein with 4Fe4S-binding SPASM domain